MPIYLVSDMITNSPDKITGHFHQGTIQKIEYNPSTNRTDIYFTKNNDNTTYFVKVNKKIEKNQNNKKNMEVSFLCANSKQDPVVKASDKNRAPVCQVDGIKIYTNIYKNSQDALH